MVRPTGVGIPPTVQQVRLCADPDRAGRAHSQKLSLYSRSDPARLAEAKQRARVSIGPTGGQPGSRPAGAPTAGVSVHFLSTSARVQPQAPSYVCPRCPTGAAIVASLARTARVITAAAAIMIAVFAAFVPSPDIACSITTKSSRLDRHHPRRTGLVHPTPLDRPRPDPHPQPHAPPATPRVGRRGGLPYRGAGNRLQMGPCGSSRQSAIGDATWEQHLSPAHLSTLGRDLVATNPAGEGQPQQRQNGCPAGSA